MDYNEILLQAIDTVVSSRISGLQYDKTVKCQIVQDLGNNFYQVIENDSVKYEVSATETYAVGDWVYVLVPQSDYARKKVIVSRYVDEDSNAPVEYANPLDRVIPIGGQYSVEGVHKILANWRKVADEDLSNNEERSSTREAIQIWEKNLSDETLGYENAVLGISANFKALFNGYDIRKGNYGLKIYLTSNSSILQLELDSSDMFGNPYNYNAFYKQNVLFDLSSISEVNNIRIVLYQKNNFTYLDENRETQEFDPYLDRDKGVVLPANIAVDGISLVFGVDAAKVADNTLELSSLDSDMTYTSSDYSKDLELVWYNKTSGNKFLGFSDGKVDLEYDEKNYLEKQSTSYSNKITSADGVAPLRESLQIYSNSLQIPDLLDDIKSYLDLVNKYVVSKLEEEDDIIYDGYNNFANKWKEEYSTFTKNAKKAYDNVKDDKDFLLEVANFRQYKSFTTAQEKLKAKATKLSENSDQSSTYSIIISQLDYYAEHLDELIAQINTLQNNSNSNATLYLGKLATKNLKPYEDEYAEFVEKNENRYCIYWYIKNPSNEDALTGKGWERLGITYPETQSDGKSYIACSKPQFQATLNTKTENSKIKVLLYFNHEQYSSNILEFTNSSYAEESASSSAQGSAETLSSLVIEHGSNSQSSYQKYNANYQLVVSADEKTQRELKIKFKNDNNLLKDKDAFIYWYIPEEGTMLNYSGNHLTAKGFSNLTEALALGGKAEDENDAVYATLADKKKDGYVCYYKKINNLQTDIVFYYQISRVYNLSNTENTIKCILTLDGIDYSAEKAFTFATYGTCGTDYTLALGPLGAQCATTPDDPLELSCELVGYKGENPDKDLNITYNWVYSTSVGKTSADNGVEISATPLNVGKPYALLKASVNYDGVSLSTCYPVPIAKQKDYYLKGTSQVVYNSLGTLESTNNIEAYELCDANGAIAGVSYDIRYYDKNGTLVSNPTSDEKFGAPELSGNKLSPPTMFVEGALNAIVRALVGGEVVYLQPIYMIQDRWEASLLNSWGGSLEIDKAGGTILGTMLGAGYKDSENSFNGVLMGRVKINKDTNTGLFGYHQGAQSFGFRNDGTAFIGKSGSGRIEFDGTNGTIGDASGNMEINFTKGTIIAKIFELNAWNANSGIYLNNRPNKNSELIEKYWFKIGEDDGPGKRKYIGYTTDGDLELYIDDIIINNFGNSDEKKNSLVFTLENRFTEVNNTIKSEITNLRSYVDGQTYLTQEATFNALTNNGTVKGIFSKDDGEGNFDLYINATYISTGILRSSNWGGILWDENGNSISPEEVDPNSKYTLTATQGMYIDLNRGQIFAKEFELNALDNGMGTGIYMSNSPDNNKNKYYFFAGRANDDNETTPSYIALKDDGLAIVSPNITIGSWISGEGGFLLCSQPAEGDYYFAAGGSGRDNTGYITISKSKHIRLIAPNIIIQSDPDDSSNCYFYVGDNDKGYLAFDKDNNFSIKAKIFELNATANGSGVYLNSNPGTGGDYFCIGDNTSFIKLAKGENGLNFRIESSPNSEENLGMSIYSNGEKFHFLMGDGENYLKFDNYDNKMLIATSGLDLQIKEEENIIFYLSSFGDMTRDSLVQPYNAKERSKTNVRFSIAQNSNVVEERDSDYQIKEAPRNTTTGKIIFNHTFTLLSKNPKKLTYQWAVKTTSNVSNCEGIRTINFEETAESQLVSDENSRVNVIYKQEDDQFTITITAPYDRSVITEGEFVPSSKVDIRYSYELHEDAGETKIWMGADGSFQAQGGKIGPFHFTPETLTVEDPSTTAFLSNAFSTRLSQERLQAPRMYGRWFSCANSQVLKFNESESPLQGFYLPYGAYTTDTYVGICPDGIYLYTYDASKGKLTKQEKGIYWSHLFELYDRISETVAKE